jgi:hypothetical protein
MSAHRTDANSVGFWQPENLLGDVAQDQLSVMGAIRVM